MVYTVLECWYGDLFTGVEGHRTVEVTSHSLDVSFVCILCFDTPRVEYPCAIVRCILRMVMPLTRCAIKGKCRRL
jgi:hypothetical protein